MVHELDVAVPRHTRNNSIAPASHALDLIVRWKEIECCGSAKGVWPGDVGEFVGSADSVGVMCGIGCVVLRGRCGCNKASIETQRRLAQLAPHLARRGPDASGVHIVTLPPANANRQPFPAQSTAQPPDAASGDAAACPTEGTETTAQNRGDGVTDTTRPLPPSSSPSLSSSPPSGAADKARAPQHDGVDGSESGAMTVSGTPDCSTCRCGGGIGIGITAHVLAMRGPVTPQPVVDGPTGIALAWNGEAYAGIPALELGDNDTRALLAAMVEADQVASAAGTDPAMTVPTILGRVRGPWAAIIWHPASRRLWFGRDFFGRRSLLWQRGVESDSAPFLTLASVAPASDTHGGGGGGGGHMSSPEWEEVPATGLHFVELGAGSAPLRLGHVAWGDEPSFPRPIAPFNASVPAGDDDAPVEPELYSAAVDAFLDHLHKAVRRRVDWLAHTDPAHRPSTRLDGGAPDAHPPPACSTAVLARPSIAVLFSGGIDSMMIAAVLDRVLPPGIAVDLVNVAFENPRLTKDCDAAARYAVPDRVTGETGVAELRGLGERTWRFVPVDVPFVELSEYRDSIKLLVRPLGSVMDESIGCALWFAARAVRQAAEVGAGGTVVLVGMGADEQLAGYGRHRTRFAKGGWAGLVAEVEMDIDRISTRNLGRDDRVISDHGIEARFPFLDEDVVSFLNELPLHRKVDFRLPRGLGEKKLLRDCARMIGLGGSADLPKRAIQFGSRIAKIDGAKIKGSDRM